MLTGRKSIQLFANWIYKDKDIYLHRKYETFHKEHVSLEQLQDRKLKRTQAAVMQRKENFLKDYEKNKCITTACSNININELTFKRWIKNDNQFKKEYEQINLAYTNSNNTI